MNEQIDRNQLLKPKPLEGKNKKPSPISSDFNPMPHSFTPRALCILDLTWKNMQPLEIRLHVKDRSMYTA